MKSHGFLILITWFVIQFPNPGLPQKGVGLYV
jgi:hypothetical protein